MFQVLYCQKRWTEQHEKKDQVWLNFRVHLDEKTTLYSCGFKIRFKFRHVKTVTHPLSTNMLIAEHNCQYLGRDHTNLNAGIFARFIRKE